MKDSTRKETYFYHAILLFILKNYYENKFVNETRRIISKLALTYRYNVNLIGNRYQYIFLMFQGIFPLKFDFFFNFKNV